MRTPIIAVSGNHPFVDFRIDNAHSKKSAG